MEPTGLIPDAPSKRPADIMIRLSPPAKQTKTPATILQLLDVTIPHPQNLTTPNGLDERLIDLKNLAEIADRSHLKAIRDKYQGKTTTTATHTDTIATITERNYALIPFTIDHLGRLGYTAHQFLGMPDVIFPPTPPNWNKPSDVSTTNEFSFKAYKFAETSPQGLLRCVNAVWHELSNDTYGDTYHTATPAIWFQQNLSLNLSIAIANHLTNARNKLSNPSTKTKHDIHGSPYPFSTRHYHDRYRSTPD